MTHDEQNWKQLAIAYEAKLKQMREALTTAKAHMEHHISGPYGTHSDTLALAEISEALAP